MLSEFQALCRTLGFKDEQNRNCKNVEEIKYPAQMIVLYFPNSHLLVLFSLTKFLANPHAKISWRSSTEGGNFRATNLTL